jgi:polyhydroxyalkanoate synthase
MTKRSVDYYVDPETFVAETPRKSGSWWPEWVAWLAEHSGAPADPPPMGAAAAGYIPLCEAPGAYVLQS